jgi:hypothetical protein
MYEDELEWEPIYVPNTDLQYYNFPGVCRYNLGVACNDKEVCYHCGWNPAIERIRKAKNREALREQ